MIGMSRLLRQKSLTRTCSVLDAPSLGSQNMLFHFDFSNYIKGIGKTSSVFRTTDIRRYDNQVPVEA